MLPVFSSKRRRSVFVPRCAPALAVEYGLLTPSEPQNNPYFTATNVGGELDGRVFGQLKVVGMQGNNRTLLLGH